MTSRPLAVADETPIEAACHSSRPASVAGRCVGRICPGQWWFADGDQFVSNTTGCLAEVPNSAQRITVACDHLTANPGYTGTDDMLQVTPDNGTYLPVSVSDWQADWKIHA